MRPRRGTQSPRTGVLVGGGSDTAHVSLPLQRTGHTGTGHVGTGHVGAGRRPHQEQPCTCCLESRLRAVEQPSACTRPGVRGSETASVAQ